MKNGTNNNNNLNVKENNIQTIAAAATRKKCYAK
jgi:hypothetical protein